MIKEGTIQSFHTGKIENIYEIDFDFMEIFIEELEKEKINELNNYLQIT